MPLTAEELRARASLTGPDPKPYALDFDSPAAFWQAIREVAREEALAASPRLVKGQVSGGLSSDDQRTDFQRNSQSSEDGGRYPSLAGFYPTAEGDQQWALQTPGGGGLLLLGSEQATTDKTVADMVHRDGSVAMTAPLAVPNPVAAYHAATAGWVTAYAETPSGAQARANAAQNAAINYTNSALGSYYTAGQVDSKLSGYAAAEHTHSQYAAVGHGHGQHRHSIPSGGSTGYETV